MYGKKEFSNTESRKKARAKAILPHFKLSPSCHLAAVLFLRRSFAADLQLLFLKLLICKTTTSHAVRMCWKVLKYELARGSSGFQ